jgi:hypothetical protein
MLIVKKILISIALLAFSATSLYSQIDSFFLTTKVRVFKDERIDTLISRLYENNEEKPTISGYRIQIYLGSIRKEAMKTKADFLQNYSNINIYLDYLQPNYKVRVGDFRNRIEAQKLYHQLLDDPNFKAVLIVPDNIYLPDL